MKTVQMTASIGRMKITNKDTSWLRRYSQFESLADFNSNWEQIMLVYKKKFTKTQHIILNRVRKFAGSEVPGVCNATYRSIREALVDKGDFSTGNVPDKKTVYLTIKKAEEFGLLHIAEGWRPNRSRTGNVIIFARMEDVVPNALRQEIEDEKALQERLDREFEANQAILNFAAIKRAAHAERQQKKAEQEAAAAAAEKQQKQQKQSEKASMYAKAKKYMQDRGCTPKESVELTQIMYKVMKDAMNANNRLTQQQAEKIALEGLQAAFNGPVKKNIFAKLSGILKRKYKELDLAQQGEVMSEYEVAARRGKFKRLPQWLADKKGLTEAEQDRLQAINSEALKGNGKKVGVVPEWFKKDATAPKEGDIISPEEQEAIRAQILSKLGRN